MATAHTGDIKMDAAAITAFMGEVFPQADGHFSIDRVDAEGISLTQATAEGNLRPGNTISGPTLMACADFASYVVVLSRIGPAALAVTSNLNMNFLRRPRLGDLRGEARMIKLGRTLAVTEVEVFSLAEDGDPNAPVAHAIVTYSLALVGASTGGGA